MIRIDFDSGLSAQLDDADEWQSEFAPLRDHLRVLYGMDRVDYGGQEPNPRMRRAQEVIDGMGGKITVAENTYVSPDAPH